ncbi:MAG: EutN/CcmL family microcompartment protein [Verrucomicrobiae bacterium]|nr:EutN/CcmL family microcompartment protein [Verrucomicrobiae bacterium]
MMLCRVDGNITSTVKHPTATGVRFLICQPITADGAEVGAPTVAVDTLGAGLHARVIVTTDGKYMTEVLKSDKTPVRNSIIGIVDQ